MKKKLAAILAGAMLLTVQANVFALTLSDNRNKETAPAFEESDFEVLDYYYQGSSDTAYEYVIVTNNSEATVEVKGTATGYDADGAELAEKSMRITVLGPGETSMERFIFINCEGIAKIDYTLEYNAQTYYKPVVANLEVEGAINDDNVVVYATNNGEYAAQYVEACALFFDENDNVVDCDYVYLTDGDGEIKPGHSIAGAVDTSYDFANVSVYMLGQSDGEVSHGGDFDLSQIEVTEHLLNGSRSSYDYLVIKNNSEEIISLDFNSLARDAEGNMVGADHTDVDVLGPGETTVAYFYYSGATNVDSVAYTYSVDTDPLYAPVIAGLSGEATLRADGVDFEVTNEGEKPALFVEVYCLFMDADGNLVDAGDAYVTDDDYEIKPGATLSGKINTYDAFDHPEIYMTGRAEK